ncbi:MAG: hypothetical protein AB8H12_11165 [Lewinella sp.]
MMSEIIYSYHNCFFVYALAFLMLPHCADIQNESVNDSSIFSTSIPHYDLPSKPLSAVGDVTGVVSGIRRIQLSPDVAERIGIISEFMVVDGTDLILIDDVAGSIVRLNAAGKIVWQVLAKDDDYRFFTNIVECTFDSFSRRIIVHNSEKSFFFDFDGNPIDVKQKPGFDYHQLFYASSSDQLFSAQGYRNDHIISSSKQLFWFKDSILQEVLINSVPYAPEFAFYGGLPEFTRLNDETYYHATLHDTFFKVNLPSVLPAFTLDVPTRPTIEEIMRNESIDRKFRFMTENGIPILISVVPDVNNIFISYKYNRRNYFSVLDRKTKKWIVGSEMIRYENTYLFAPVLYHDNYFLREMPDYRVAHLAKLAEGTDPDSEWKEELARLDEAYDERGGKTIYLIRL